MNPRAIESLGLAAEVNGKKIPVLGIIMGWDSVLLISTKEATESLLTWDTNPTRGQGEEDRYYIPNIECGFTLDDKRPYSASLPSANIVKALSLTANVMGKSAKVEELIDSYRSLIAVVPLAQAKKFLVWETRDLVRSHDLDEFKVDGIEIKSDDKCDDPWFVTIGAKYPLPPSRECPDCHQMRYNREFEWVHSRGMSVCRTCINGSAATFGQEPDNEPIRINILVGFRVPRERHLECCSCKQLFYRDELKYLSDAQKDLVPNAPSWAALACNPCKEALAEIVAQKKKEEDEAAAVAVAE